ncbi:MAG: UbiD family decarboxylase [Desulfobacterales bacterium]|nr:UbiD family decarboxylase [Desulfobacterales bacterium]
MGKYYKDLREYISVLKKKGKLVTVTRQINKDLELMPLVRCQFRGLPAEERKAFLFENVVDVKGRRYDIPVLVAGHAGSRDLYALAMQCKPEEITARWQKAQLEPIEPRMVDSGPAQEEVHEGDNLLEHGGLEEFPIPISTPGFDNAPYLTCANWVTKDLETNIRNMGNYRAMIKSKNRTGISILGAQHLRVHWEKCRKKGIPLQAAIVLGASPNIGLVGTARLPYGLDEYKVAGGIAGEAVALVKCRTVDIEVPATAEIVIEGQLPTDVLEREAPFGEFPGYIGGEAFGPLFNVTCITHRKNPVFTAFISQFPPSESTILRGVGQEAALLKFLRHSCNIPGIMDVALPEACGSHSYCVVQLKKFHPGEAWQALDGVAAYNVASPKIIVAVDEDIDPRDPDAVNWAMCFRMQPHNDVKISKGKAMSLDPSLAPLSAPESEQRYPFPTGGSALLIDATMKWPYPPVALPRKEIMENALNIWQELKLPKLKLKAPWHGYELGYWTAENREEAELALKGEHYQTGEKLARKRVKT